MYLKSFTLLRHKSAKKQDSASAKTDVALEKKNETSLCTKAHHHKSNRKSLGGHVFRSIFGCNFAHKGQNAQFLPRVFWCKLIKLIFFFNL